MTYSEKTSQQQLRYMITINLAKKDTQAPDHKAANSFATGLINEVKALFSALSVLSSSGLQVNLDHVKNSNQLCYHYAAIIFANQKADNSHRILAETVFTALQSMINGTSETASKQDYLFSVFNNSREELGLNELSIKTRIKLKEIHKSISNRLTNNNKKLFIHFEFTENQRNIPNNNQQQDLFMLNKINTHEVTSDNHLQPDTSDKNIHLCGENKTIGHNKIDNNSPNITKSQDRALTTKLELLLISPNPKMPTIFREGHNKNQRYYLDQNSREQILTNFDRFRSKSYKYRVSFSGALGSPTVTLSDEAFLTE